MATKKKVKVVYPKQLYAYMAPGHYIYADETVQGVLDADGKPRLVGIYELKETANFVGEFKRV